MMLCELQERLNRTDITEEQLWELHPIYCLLDFDKDDFCKLITAIGLEKWLAKAKRWQRLDTAEQEYTDKEKYNQVKAKLEDLERQKRNIENEIIYAAQFINHYENYKD